MSYELFGDDVLFFQRILKIEGLYAGELDGIWGPLTESGADAFHSQSEEIKNEFGVFDPRTERNIQMLILTAQIEARKFMDRLWENDINAKIISGTRTYEEQDKLYRQGRWGNPGNVVTNARGGRSNHNFGMAWDIGIFSDFGEYSQDVMEYMDAARFGKSDQLEWGGDWRTFPDPPHYQLKTGYELTVVRARFENGETFLA